MDRRAFLVAIGVAPLAPKLICAQELPRPYAAYYGLDLSVVDPITDLARIAQSRNVVAGKDSSAAFSGLIHGNITRLKHETALATIKPPTPLTASPR